MSRLIDRFNPMAETQRLVDGATAYAETPAAGPIFREFLRANHGVSLADFNEWPAHAKELVLLAFAGCQDQKPWLSGGHDAGPLIGRREITPLDYEHPTFVVPCPDEEHDFPYTPPTDNITGRWWFPLAFVGGILVLWGLLKWMGVK